MNKFDKATLANKASIEDIEHPNCIECDEPLYFALKDNHHSFSLPLSTLLECLKFAEDEGVIPPIDSEWWVQVSNLYSE